MLAYYSVYGEDKRKCFNIVNIDDLENALETKAFSVTVRTDSDEEILLNDVGYDLLNEEAHNWMCVGKCEYNSKGYRAEICICPKFNECELVLKPL